MKTVNKPATSANRPLWQLWLDGAEDLVKVWDQKPSRHEQTQHDKQRKAVERSPHFYGIRTNETEARNVLTHGYKEGAALVEALAQAITEEMPEPASRRRVRKWREDGDELNLDRYRLGYDTPWRSMHRKLKRAPGLIEVVTAWGENCGADVGQLQWSGAAALALTDLLEKADYSVELALVAAMQNGNDTSLVRVDLKRMGEVVNLETLAAVAVYPPAWRLYGLCAFQLGPFSSGDNFNSHPHSSFMNVQESLGMWDYRPNVMTLKLAGCDTESSAKHVVLEALKNLETLVNPQDAEES